MRFAAMVFRPFSLCRFLGALGAFQHRQDFVFPQDQIIAAVKSDLAAAIFAEQDMVAG
jgi:hypothetical protein